MVLYHRGMEPPKFLRTGLVASFLGVSPRTIRRWLVLGQIDCFTTPGGERRIPVSEIERLLGRSLSTPEVR